MSAVTRRRVLLAVPAVGAALGAARSARSEPTASSLDAAYPSTDLAAAREIVGPSHGNFDRVRELVTARPELAKAAYDWGFGDWETALGAASHTGQRKIAELLIEHGARPDLFTAAMLGQLDVVRAAIAARPGIQGQHGPHGITLLAHAEAGGEAAAPVAKFLKEIGGADVGYTDLPLTDAQRLACEGTYSAGPAPADHFAVTTDRGNLSIRRADGPPRRLFHQGDGEFHPAGARSVRIRLPLQGGAAGTLSIQDGGMLVEARRLAK